MGAPKCCVCEKELYDDFIVHCLVCHKAVCHMCGKLIRHSTPNSMVCKPCDEATDT